MINLQSDQMLEQSQVQQAKTDQHVIFQDAENGSLYINVTCVANPSPISMTEQQIPLAFGYPCRTEAFLVSPSSASPSTA